MAHQQSCRILIIVLLFLRSIEHFVRIGRRRNKRARGRFGRHCIRRTPCKFLLRPPRGVVRHFVLLPGHLACATAAFGSLERGDHGFTAGAGTTPPAEVVCGAMKRTRARTVLGGAPAEAKPKFLGLGFAAAAVEGSPV